MEWSFPSSRAPSMKRIKYLLVLSFLQPAFSASAEEHNGRIKKRPPGIIEAERIASDMAMNDSLLRKGDVIATDRGFLVFRGLAPDGITNDFESIPNPVPSPKK